MERRGFHPALRRRAGIALATWAIAFSLLAVANALPSPPTAVLDVDDPTPFIGEPVHFDASKSIGHDEGNGAIVAYRFDFGDGGGTEWQASPFAEHAYEAIGTHTATVDVRDRRNLVGHAEATVDVQKVPPPTGEAPDLVPLAASVSPPKPDVDDILTLAVTLMNRGGTAAQSASVDIVDARPSGAEILVDTLRLSSPLDAGALTVLVSPSFLAVEPGNHTIRITIRDVSPKETRIADNVLDMPMEVFPRTPDGGTGGQGGALFLSPVVLGLLGAAIVALVGALAFLARPVEIKPLTPPPPEPPDRRPPPIWPP